MAGPRDALLHEVELELDRIKEKYKRRATGSSDFCTGDNLSECLEYLAEELDYLDVSCITVPDSLSDSRSLKKVLVQLSNSCYNLLNVHKDTLKRQDDVEIRSKSLESEIKVLNKRVDTVQRDIDCKENQLAESRRHHRSAVLETECLRSRADCAKRDADRARAGNAYLSRCHSVEVRRLKLGQSVVHPLYPSDKRVAETIGDLRKRIEAHEKREGQLLANNELLLEEVVQNSRSRR